MSITVRCPHCTGGYLSPVTRRAAGTITHRAGDLDNDEDDDDVYAYDQNEKPPPTTHYTHPDQYQVSGGYG